jgi:hypothetical protein
MPSPPFSATGRWAPLLPARAQSDNTDCEIQKQEIFVTKYVAVRKKLIYKK